MTSEFFKFNLSFPDIPYVDDLLPLICPQCKLSNLRYKVLGADGFTTVCYIKCENCSFDSESRLEGDYDNHKEI
jgi:hypothetical protein